jgi:hypothetical protein
VSWWCVSQPIRSLPNFSALLVAPPIESARFQPIIADNIAPHHHENVQSRAAPHLPYVRLGSWLRENAEIEFANGNFVSTSINLKNKSAGDGCREKIIEKTILRAFRARTFSRSQGHSRPGRASSKSGHVRYARKAEVISAQSGLGGVIRHLAGLAADHAALIRPTGCSLCDVDQTGSITQKTVMAGLVPAMHVVTSNWPKKRRCPA